MTKNLRVTVDIAIARKMLKIAGYPCDEINNATDEEIFEKALKMNDCYGMTYEEIEG